MRDLVKKLIYSLEQANLTSLDAKQHEELSKNPVTSQAFGNKGSSTSPVNQSKLGGPKNAAPLLPNLLNNQSL